MADRVDALDTRADLNRYTHLNAGCVGEFWTDMVVAHRPRCAIWDLPAMRARGVRFGQGCSSSTCCATCRATSGSGACYLPSADLATLGLVPRDLLSPAALPRVRPSWTR